MNRLELVAHLTASMPKLELDALHIYCLVAPGTEGAVTSTMIQSQTHMHRRTCERALVRLMNEGHLCRTASKPAPEQRGHPPDLYSLTPKGTALVKQLLNL